MRIGAFCTRFDSQKAFESEELWRVMVLAADGEVICGTRTSMGAAGLGAFEGACVWTEFSLSRTRGRGEADPGDESDTLA